MPRWKVKIEDKAEVELMKLLIDKIITNADIKVIDNRPSVDLEELYIKLSMIKLL